jgi:hypothetical protein
MEIPVPWDAKAGDLIACGNCAGVLFRLGEEGGKDVLALVQLVSCPVCGERIPVDDGTPEGDTVRHGGAEFRLAKEFGAFTLEPVPGAQPVCGAAGLAEESKEV